MPDRAFNPSLKKAYLIDSVSSEIEGIMVCPKIIETVNGPGWSAR